MQQAFFKHEINTLLIHYDNFYNTWLICSYNMGGIIFKYMVNSSVFAFCFWSYEFLFHAAMPG